MLFAHLKRILKLGQLRLRSPNGARDEFLLAATAQNLRKFAKLVTPAVAIPPPEGGAGLQTRPRLIQLVRKPDVFNGIRPFLP